MKVKYLVIFVFIISICILSAFLPIWGWFFNIFKNQEYSVSQLLIITPKSASKILVDGQLKGLTESDKEFTLSGITKGVHKIELHRDSSSEGFYEKFEKSIDFEPGTGVQIIWSAGPTLQSSSGVIKYFQKQVSNESPHVKLSVYPDDTNIYFDKTKVTNRIEINDMEKHLIVVSKEGYTDQQIEVQMTKSNGNQIKDYNLIIEVYLFQVPIQNI